MKITMSKLRKTIRKIIVESVGTPAEFTEIANLLISTDEDQVRKGIAMGEQTDPEFWWPIRASGPP